MQLSCGHARRRRILWRRRAGVEREAKSLAALNHPNIATLLGMEESDGRHFLVIELVPGETLAEKLARAPLPLEAAISTARQIAEALEAAHEKGIVHRDLKPANVKITPDDKVKVLDFGLAKAAEADPTSPSMSLANSPTMSAMATQAGMILGTASYMSPEQARGLAADHRSDIFSFGVVLYEKMTPFGAIVSRRPTGAIFSPDGRWVAYTMREAKAGADAVYEQPFPATGAKVQISTNAETGHHPVWSSDGKELYYNPGPGSRLVAVTVMASQGFGFGPAPPVAKPFSSNSSIVERTYDVARDGKRFLGLMSATTAVAAGPSRPELRVVLNWLEELKARAPIKK